MIEGVVQLRITITHLLGLGRRGLNPERVGQPVCCFIGLGVVKQHQIGPFPIAPAAAMLRVRLNVVVGRREHTW